MTRVAFSALLALLLTAGCGAIDGSPQSPSKQAISAKRGHTAIDVAKARAEGREPLFAWAPFEASSFERARREGRFVLLHGSASWCHFCHVMEAVTYRDPEVGRVLRDRFVAIRVDIDARPDVAERYGEWGWPATILLSPEAEELGKYRGYLPPEEMRAALAAALVEGPTISITAKTAADVQAPVSALPWIAASAARISSGGK